ncbi:LysR family transcriptional regulator [Streptococcus macedonicus]|uniref:LysR family transcriptional regulator n=2 Tax=Streptococcus TaxID=1301 RepID=A0A380K2P4_9STRE|nr:LysR family transcriptional regulator [Streptococcus macedonicus]CCF02962.1 LysR family transcriptional regulator [Streptococcus macedonicus ACA-DC 198]SUN58466.1 LysR family transcriptional regulator [Streptococcus gallolyticus]KEH51756.1 LysR family transcriptional regulator [Streptococcus macedonicus]MBT1047538.1 LysR family transcriptional regulator [Streptococcus macedonicus]MCW8644851.1 LysR family transcriptional regulator [Streptococcus macedonicus]
MVSKYAIFCSVIELGSFTKTAKQLNYSQSAVSQTIKNLEEEIGTCLLTRGNEGIKLTKDGQTLYPYFQQIVQGEKQLTKKIKELQGLDKAEIRIGIFTSASRNFILPFIKAFKANYPSVNFVLKQGEYTSIYQWLETGQVDLGFTHMDYVGQLQSQILYQDSLYAVLPSKHPLAQQSEISLADLAQTELILLDEGDHSLTRTAFAKENIVPTFTYEIYDDYTILEMIRQGLGVSLLYENFLDGLSLEDLAVRQISENPFRTVVLAWKNWQTLPLAAQQFTKNVSSTIHD